MKKIILVFSFAGLFIPVLLILIWKLITMNLREQYNINFGDLFLLLWPSSIFLLASEGQKIWGIILIAAISISINIIFYVFIAFIFYMIWWFLKKKPWALFFTLVLIISIWVLIWYNCLLTL